MIAPAYDGYFADPFVWRHGDRWFAVGTGPAEAAGNVRTDGVFPLLQSTDFRSWHRIGEALERPDPAFGDSYWAPEIAAQDGIFYLYYSVGFGDSRHHLRVAVATRPEGPYGDAGALTDPALCPFAIDPHPFRDIDGTWWLFHARDFLDAGGDIRAGTALVVQRLGTMTQLAGDPSVVLRARHDWQRFLADRLMYGRRFDWHTLEGPCVRRHGGVYWCFYSGGRWETDSYGVDYAVANRVLGPWSDHGGEAAPRLLRTIPGQLIGPGHNSIVTGADGREYVAYHAWDAHMRMRRMYVSPLTWDAAGPRLLSR
ncbi:MAG: glycoside hydrolase family 43 protein [Candidatus Binatia bacterium]